jgi:hypothetical protein
MRTPKATAVFLLVSLMLSPAPAHAWWGWLDDLSGPGTFRGPQFEFRAMCFGPESEAKQLLGDLKNADALARKLIGGDESSTVSRQLAAADANAALDAWRQLIARLNATKRTFPVLNAEEVRKVSSSILAMAENQLVTLAAAPPPQQPPSIRDATGRATVPQTVQLAPAVSVQPRAVSMFLNDPEAKLPPMTAAVTRGISSIGSTGVFLSACSTDIKRRSSVDFGVNFWHADGAESFANGQQIRLTTLMPIFSIRVFTDPRFDVWDAGIGAGVYWFTSKGSDSFNGVVLQPARFDFHAPTLWSTYPLNSAKNWARRIAAAPMFRISVMNFPAGFPPDAFAGTGQHHDRIGSELVKSWSLFFNVQPFIRKAPFVGKSDLVQ